MGGFLARLAASQDPSIKAIGLISAADMGVDRIEALPLDRRSEGLVPVAARYSIFGTAPLPGTSTKALAEEAIATADAWNIPALAPKLAARPILVITSDDGLTPQTTHSSPL